MAQSPFAKHIQPSVKADFKHHLTPQELKGLRGPRGTFQPDGIPTRGFGSAGVQPRRNPTFASQQGLAAWKAKHPKSGAQYAGVEQDIDDDGVAEFMVKRGDDVVAVNGWELKPSAWKYEQKPNYSIVDVHTGEHVAPGGLWSSRATKKAAYRNMYVEEDMKGIFSTFGQYVVKPVFTQLFGGEKSPPVATRGINGQMGEAKRRTSSFFNKGVARVLIGNQLDDEMIGAGQDAIVERWGPEPDMDVVKNTLHKSKTYKAEFKRRLQAYSRTLFVGQGAERQFVREVYDKVAQAINTVGQFGGDDGRQIGAPAVVVAAAQEEAAPAAPGQFEIVGEA